jgi:hypothetical protein
LFIALPQAVFSNSPTGFKWIHLNPVFVSTQFGRRRQAGADLKVFALSQCLDVFKAASAERVSIPLIKQTSVASSYEDMATCLCGSGELQLPVTCPM